MDEAAENEASIVWHPGAFDVVDRRDPVSVRIWFTLRNPVNNLRRPYPQDGGYDQLLINYGR